jgi:hypothetical protein
MPGSKKPQLRQRISAPITHHRVSTKKFSRFQPQGGGVFFSPSPGVSQEEVQKEPRLGTTQRISEPNVKMEIPEDDGESLTARSGDREWVRHSTEQEFTICEEYLALDPKGMDSWKRSGEHVSFRILGIRSRSEQRVYI